MPEIAYIDEDYGQLEGMDSENDDFYPVTFPCVLIGNAEADWKDIGMGTQAGQVQLAVRLGIDCYHDTHIGSGTTDKIRERMELAGKLYRTLQGYRFSGFMDEMARIKAGTTLYPAISKCTRLYLNSVFATNLRYRIACIIAEQGKLPVCKTGSPHFRYGLYVGISLAAFPDNGHDTLLGYEEFLL
jgi:hypothetical protein